MSHNPDFRGGEEATIPTRVRVVAADKLVADALGAALSGVPGIELAEAPESAHVLLWDSGSDKLVAQRALSQLSPSGAGEPAVPVLALAHDEAHAAALLTAGARGAVLRHASAVRIAAAAVAIRFGLHVLDIELASATFGAVLAPTAPEHTEPGDSGLTAREREVLGLLALGLSNKTIARRLEVSIHTIKFHVNSILSKLDADSRTAAVTVAVRRGLVTL